MWGLGFNSSIASLRYSHFKFHWFMAIFTGSNRVFVSFNQEIGLLLLGLCLVHGL